MNITGRYSAVLSILMFFVLFSCRDNGKLFQPVSSRHSGITFNNLIIENDSVNQLDNENVYNGAGVGIGDFNNDGLSDIFLTGNLVECKLYLNKGNFRFLDATDKAGVKGNGKWCRGVAVVDINNDGLEDIYVSATQLNDPEARKNILYINKGMDENNIPVFTDEAKDYGLDDDSHTSQANFFDYDNDGDLDVYLVVNEITKKISPYLFRPVMKHGTNPSTGRLYRNDYDSTLRHAVFTDVSREAGIQTEGYSHSAIITDINRDGWQDIYVGNDFLTSDLLWINNKNGTFTDEINKYFTHTSANTMGNDIADINNDGLPDVISLDMNPEDNYRRKMMLPAASYQTYQNTERFGYSYQYVRNVLQLNQGFCIQDDSVCRPVYSEIGYFAGITATDWSWTPLVADLDNDSDRDIIISNGFPKDVTDHDFGMYRIKAFKSAPKEMILKQIPEVKLHNYAFRNNSDLTFTDVSDEWGMDVPSFSNGSAYADFDNDGDLDLIINNINDEASLYKNNSREKDISKSHFLRIKTEGSLMNKGGFGTWIELYTPGQKQVWENTPYRGYLASYENIAHFGLGEQEQVDSVVIIWPGKRKQVLRNVEADKVIVVSIDEADEDHSWDVPSTVTEKVFVNVKSTKLTDYVHREEDFADFNIQKLLPHKFSEYGPSLAAGDLDGNGLDDLVAGGSVNHSAVILFQQKDGSFKKKNLTEKAPKADNAGILIFDADRDGDSDLYISSGGYENESNSPAYRDHFFVNDGSGNFKQYDEAIPENFTSKSCTRAADFDQDGDLDLFLGGRVDPWNYPKPVSSFILRNDSEPGKPRFTEATKEIAPDLINAGMVNDALFTDFDNDGWQDLVLAGEWMPVTFLKNENGIFRNVSVTSGIEDKKGWWTSVSAGDFDNDGDTDYLCGNLGLNSFYRASSDYPVSVYAADFDVNGSFDAFPSIFLPTSQEDTAKREYPVHGRDDAVKQMISMRSSFQNYKSYALSTIDRLFSEEQFKKALVRRATWLSSSFCRNEGGGRFTMIPLPAQAQFSPLNGMVIDDFDRDGNLDAVINANDYGTEVLYGRHDALNGLFLKGDGSGNFSALSIDESGIYLPGNGRSLVRYKGHDGSYMIAASVNRGPLRFFSLSEKPVLMPVRIDDVSAELTLDNGKVRKTELYYGSSFLSQSARYIAAGDNVKSIVISGSSQTRRNIDIPRHAGDDYNFNQK